MASKDREYRSFSMVKRADVEEREYIVEGYASTFEPYVMFVEHYEDGDIEYKEQISRNAFDETDMSDCVFRIDHEGRVYARTSAGTIKLSVDDNGLYNETDLSKTQNSRDLYEDIKAGNYPQMSFAFTIEEEHYDRNTHTRIIDKVGRLYDISPVAFPANPTTSLSARSRDFYDGEIEKERTERFELERKQKALDIIKNSLKEIKNYEE